VDIRERWHDGVDDRVDDDIVPGVSICKSKPGGFVEVRVKGSAKDTRRHFFAYLCVAFAYPLRHNTTSLFRAVEDRRE